MKHLLSLFILSLFTITNFAQEVSLTLFADGFSNPVDLQNAGDERLFVVEKAGVIKILNQNGTISPTPFIDLSPIVINPGGSWDERGLLGLAFHPDYSNNGYFYVNYINNAGNTQISRFSVSTTDSNIANINSELQLLEISQPYSNHNGGCLQFGPDGFLYIGMGDGGSAGDPENRSQNLTTFLGKMLRIDIDTQTDGNNYAIPTNNPFVDNPNALDEIWAYGLRNPWRFSFDSQTEKLWIADVGQNSYEEINSVFANESGLNYGWRCYEGNSTYNTNGCPDESEMTFPIAEYSHSGGNCSISGGYVYRGTMYSDIFGLYFYADFCSGIIGTVDNNNNQINHGEYDGSWVSFGEDFNKELYILDNSGSIFKIAGGVLAISDTSEKDISIFPNPVSDNLHVTIASNLINSITISDIKGSILFSEEALYISEKTINISSFNPGVYFIKIISSTGLSAVKKLIIK